MIHETHIGYFADIPSEPYPRGPFRSREQAERAAANVAARRERQSRRAFPALLIEERREGEESLYRATDFARKVVAHVDQGWTDDPAVAAAVEALNKLDDEVVTGEAPTP